MAKDTKKVKKTTITSKTDIKKKDTSSDSACYQREKPCVKMKQATALLESFTKLVDSVQGILDLLIGEDGQ